jgi:hypothetical protein
MMARRFTLSPFVGFGSMLGALALFACQGSHGAPSAGVEAVASAASAAPTPVSRGAESAAVTVVADASQVCMVNNQFMGRPQIPVQVDGRTYYGCCAMCKGRLQGDAAARSAIDPVTNATVDKALAVIGKTATGSVLYFENLEHFQTYAERVQAR